MMNNKTTFSMNIIETEDWGMGSGESAQGRMGPNHCHSQDSENFIKGQEIL